LAKKTRYAGIRNNFDTFQSQKDPKQYLTKIPPKISCLIVLNELHCTIGPLLRTYFKPQPAQWLEPFPLRLLNSKKSLIGSYKKIQIMSAKLDKLTFLYHFICIHVGYSGTVAAIWGAESPWVYWTFRGLWIFLQKYTVTKSSS